MLVDDYHFYPFSNTVPTYVFLGEAKEVLVSVTGDLWHPLYLLARDGRDESSHHPVILRSMTLFFLDSVNGQGVRVCSAARVEHMDLGLVVSAGPTHGLFGREIPPASSIERGRT